MPGQAAGRKRACRWYRSRPTSGRPLIRNPEGKPMKMSSRWDSVVEAMGAHHREHPANLPGAVFAAETRDDGRFVDSVGKGWNTDTICEIGSMTKPFISAAVLLALEERDMLDVEVPVSQLPGMDVW